MSGPAALRGAIGFCTRLPVGRTSGDWEAFRTTPAALPLVGYLVGVVLAVPVAGGAVLPDVAVGVALPVVAYGLTGIAHLDGLADCGDAAAVHGDAERRLAVMDDAALGVGGTLAVALAVLGLGLAGVGLGRAAGDGAALGAAAVVVAAEVGARGAAGGLAALGTAAHEGLGTAVTEPSGPTAAATVGVATVPVAAAAVAVPAVLPALVAVPLAVVPLWAWARARLGGVSGDVLGAATELGRIAGLHAGLAALTVGSGVAP